MTLTPMTLTPTTLNRRAFLKNSSATALSAASLGGIATSLAGFQAQAADTTGYKALVCLFLFGGMDNNDTLLPYDQASYDRFAQIRSSLIDSHSGSRDRNNLLPLSPDNASDFDGREFALPPQMTGLRNLFQGGNAAIVGNVGPLIQPTSLAQFESQSVPLPPRLFSHNDQQSTWQSSEAEGTQFGWGGRFADAAIAAGANEGRVFTNISSRRNELFLTGEHVTSYQIGRGRTATFEIVNDLRNQDSEAVIPVVQHMRGANYMGTNLLVSDMAAAARSAFDANVLYNNLSADAPPLITAFPQNFLGRQLADVARTIAIRDELHVNRQIFFVGLGGFDTHDSQAQSLPESHAEIDSAVSSFFRATQDLGLEQDVTLFTASDFGRTLSENGDGTDHGWGAHHFVVGGAVQGRQILGDVPVADFDHEFDSGRGRLIPSTSVEQYAAPLGRWFGMSDAEVLVALPNRANFSSDLSTLMSV